MGINTHYYTVYGVKIDEYNEELSDALYGEGDLYEIIEECEDLSIITDGMGGNYMIFGKILFDSGDLRYNDIEDTYVEVDLNKLSEYKDKCVEQFMNYFPTFGHYMDHEWKLMTFVHYS